MNAAPASKFDWIIFTSSNGVEQCWNRLRALGCDARIFAGSRLAAIGPATIEALAQRGLHADFSPSISIAEKVAEELIAQNVNSQNILLVRALEGREMLPQMLTEAGAKVTVAPCYITMPDARDADAVRQAMERGEIDWVTFTSSSTVRNFLDAVGEEIVRENRDKFRVACIGPITAKTAEEYGLIPDAMAENASVDALIDVLLQSSSD